MLSYDPPVSSANAQCNKISLRANVSTMSNTNSNPALASSQRKTYKHQHIWLVTGPAGCGKTTVAEILANKLNMPYIEGDSYHSDANVEKMRTGTPLTDADRWDWLTALRDESTKRINAGSEGVVLTCSALKRKYRDVIRVAAYYDNRILIHFIFLDGPEEILLRRVGLRQGHYMGANMVHSQFDDLERPKESERDIISIDVSRSLNEVEADAVERVLEEMNADLNDDN